MGRVGGEGAKVNIDTGTGTEDFLTDESFS